LDDVSIRILDRVLLFDYGEVISLSPSEADRAELVRIAGVDADVFWPSYNRHRDELDRGDLDIVGYWKRIALDTGTSFGPAQVQQLWAADFRSWISVDPATVEILDELRAGGTRIALLSNAGFDFGTVFRSAPISQYFEQVFISAELNLLKPEAAIYLHAVRELGITPSELVFIDNKSINTDAAAALGITVHHFTGADGLREFVLSLAS
jgi:putative hydrolase of the HAD superfamily